MYFSIMGLVTVVDVIVVVVDVVIIVVVVVLVSFLVFYGFTLILSCFFLSCIR